MNRAHWQALAEERLLAAQTLLAAQHWSSAYYLAGYAVEFELKSCILVRVEKTGIIFQEKKFSEACWTHRIDDLVDLADLTAARISDNAANPLLRQNWQIVSAWQETSRYEHKLRFPAEDLFNAITDNVNGVMPWIRLRW